jgi:hypothetical protein
MNIMPRARITDLLTEHTLPILLADGTNWFKECPDTEQRMSDHPWHSFGARGSGRHGDRREVIGDVGQIGFRGLVGCVGIDVEERADRDGEGIYLPSESPAAPKWTW